MRSTVCVTASHTLVREENLEAKKQMGFQHLHKNYDEDIPGILQGFGYKALSKEHEWYMQGLDVLIKAAILYIFTWVSGMGISGTVKQACINLDHKCNNTDHITPAACNKHKKIGSLKPVASDYVQLFHFQYKHSLIIIIASPALAECASRHNSMFTHTRTL